MKCAECGSERFYLAGQSETLIGANPNCEIDGVRHYHDPNRFTAVFECATGHRIEIDYRELCPVKDCQFNDWIKGFSNGV